MNIFIHIGWPRTGTTTIQHFLMQNIESLHNNEGIFVIFPRNEESYLKLSRSIFENNKQSFSDILEEQMDSLKYFISEKEIKSIIFSSEHISHIKSIHLMEDLLRILLRYIKTDFKITFLAAIRRQDDFLESAYGISLVEDEIMDVCSINDYIRSNLILKSIDYYETISYLEEILKNFSMEYKFFFFIFQKKYNMLEEFLNTLGIKNKHNFSVNIRKGTSLNYFEKMVLKEINRKYSLKSIQKIKILEYLRTTQILKKFNLREDLSLVDLTKRMTILNHFRRSNEMFFDRYLKSENQFLLSSDEIKELSSKDKYFIQNKIKIMNCVTMAIKEIEKNLNSICGIVEPREEKISGFGYDGIYSWIDYYEDFNISGVVFNLETKYKLPSLIMEIDNIFKIKIYPTIEEPSLNEVVWFNNFVDEFLFTRIIPTKFIVNLVELIHKEHNIWYYISSLPLNHNLEIRFREVTTNSYIVGSLKKYRVLDILKQFSSNFKENVKINIMEESEHE